MKLFIGTGSATYANKASRTLSAVNIKNRIVKRHDDNLGCGYGVEISQGDADKITDILKNAGVKITRVIKEEV